jgi:phage terminase large subunit GpA-like protein
MGSGEADSIRTASTRTLTAGDSTGTYSATLFTTVYMYQVKCPRCGTYSWCQLDKVVKCPGTACNSRLMASNQRIDYVIEVNLVV